MIKTLSRMIRTGILTEDAPHPPKEDLAIGGLQENIRKVLGRALCIRHVDAGSCNGCELEIQASTTPITTLRESALSSLQARGMRICFS